MMNGRPGQKLAHQIAVDGEACPACGQHSVIMRQNYLVTPRALAVAAPSGAGDPMTGIETFKLCLWCLWREYRAPSKGEKRWPIRATAGPGASSEPVRQAPGGAAGMPIPKSGLAFYQTSIEMGAGVEAKIPSPEWLAGQGFGEEWDPVDVPEGLR